jgi:rSAM/selenodomain-associated transferase 1
MSHKNLLIVFTKYPIPGKAKTRLIPAIGREKAAELHRLMTERTICTAGLLAAREAVSLKIFFEGGNLEAMRAWLGKRDFKRQVSGDLGKKMLAAFEQGFSGKAQKIVIIGTDCPALTPALLRAAFLNLKTNDLVLGPAEDGGYYLIGLRKRAAFLFQDISWGSKEVFSQTQTKAAEYDLSLATLETLRDIDRPVDLLGHDGKKRCCP